MKTIKFCPRFGNKEPAPCEEIVKHEGEAVLSRCMFLIPIRGKNPITGEDIDRDMCMDEAKTIGLFDGNKLMNEMSASVQSHRNEVGEVGKLLNRIPVKQVAHEA